MERTLQILVCDADSELRTEFQSAIDELRTHQAVIHFAQHHEQALEISTNRHPHLICLPIGTVPAEFLRKARELAEVAPGATIAAIYQADLLGTEGIAALFMDAARADVRDFLRRPISTPELSDVLGRVLAPRRSHNSPVGKVISFLSNKGGVGKSTLSTNVACELARRHRGRVLLIDASLQLGICNMILGLNPSTTLTDAVRELDRVDEVLLRRLCVEHRSGLYLLAAPATAVEATEIDDAAMARVLNIARREFDIIVVDTFPILDSIVMTVLDTSNLGFIVLQGTVPNVLGTARLLPILTGLGFPAARQRVILNCSQGRRMGELTVEDIERRIGHEIATRIPYDSQVLVSMNTGTPRILTAPRFWGFGKAVRDLVDGIETELRSSVPEAETPSGELEL